MAWEADYDGEATEVLRAVLARYKAEGVKTDASINILLTGEDVSTNEASSSQVRYVLAVADSVTKPVRVGVPGEISDGTPPLWLAMFDLFLEKYVVGKPYLLFERPHEYEVQHPANVIVWWEVMALSSVRLTTAWRDFEEAETLLAKCREVTVRLKSKEIDMLIDSEKYVRVREGMLERGDTVYEVIAHGEGLVKYVPAKVVSPLRGAAEVRFMHDGRSCRLSFKRLALDKAIWAGRFPQEAVKEEAARAAALEQQSTQMAVGDSVKKDVRYMQPAQQNNLRQLPIPEPRVATESREEEFDAWKSMGKGFFDNLEKERTAIKNGLKEIEATLKKLDDQSKQEIEELENEIREAKRRHVEARAAVAARVDAGNRKLRAVDDRYNLLKPLMDQGEETDG